MLVQAALPLLAGVLARKFMRHGRERYFFLLEWRNQDKEGCTIHPIILKEARRKGKVRVQGLG